MAEGFKVADAYVDIVSKVERNALDTSAKAAGDRAGGIIAENAGRGFVQRMRAGGFRSLFAREGKSAGESMGDGIGDGLSGRRGLLAAVGGFLAGGLIGGMGRAIAGGATAIGSSLPSMLSNPYVLAGVAAAGALLAPALMAGLSGALIAGAGLGVIGLGALLLKEEPALINAATRLKETTVGIFKRAAAPMLAPFVGALGQLDGMMKRLEPTIQKAFAVMAPAIEPLTKGLVAMVENAMPGMLKMVEAAGPFLAGLGPSMGELGKGVSIFAGMIASAGPDALTFFKDLFSFLARTIVMMGLVISWTAKGYGEIRKFFVSIPGWVSTAWGAVTSFASGVWRFFTQTIPNGVSTAFGAVGSFFTGLWNRAWAATTSFFGRIGEWLGGLPGLFGGWLASAGSVVMSGLRAIGGFFAALPGQIGAFLASLPGVLFRVATDAGHRMLFAIGYGIGLVMKSFRDFPENAALVLGTLWSAISGAFTTARDRAVATGAALVIGAINWLASLGPRAAGAVANLWGMISGAFTSTKDRAVSTGASLVTGVLGWLASLPPRAVGALIGLWGSISGAFNAARAGAVSAMTSLVTGAITVLRSLPGRAGQAVSAVRSAVTGALAGAGSWLYSAGQDLLRGLIGGITSMVSAAVRAVKNAVGSVIAGAKAAAGIGSPSKVMDREVGRWLLPGVSAGVRRSIPAARRVMHRAMDAIVPSGPGVHPPAWGSGGPGPAAGGAGGTSVAIGSITLDASKIKSLQDLLKLVTEISATARSWRAATPMTPGR